MTHPSTPAGRLSSMSSRGNIFGIKRLAAIMAIRIPTSLACWLIMVALVITKLEIAIYNRFPARQLSHLANTFFGWANSSHQA
jgi:hypothetical protein